MTTPDTIIVRSNEKPATPPPAAPAAEAGKVVDEKVAAAASVPTPEEGEEAEVLSDSETEEAAEAEGEEESEEPAEAAAPKTGDEAADKTKTKKKSGFQRRLAKKDKEIEYWKGEALKKSASGTPAAPAPKPEPSHEAPIVLEIQGKPKAVDFTSNEEFVEAMAKWTSDQTIRADKAKDREARQRDEQVEIEKAHATRINAFKAKNPDFDQVVHEANGKVMVSAAMMQHFVLNDTGPDLIYELSKNPDECNRIAMLPPLKAAAELGKIEARLLPKATAPKTGKKPTNAPDPIEPVSSGNRGGSAARSIYNADQMTQAEYEAARAPK